MEMNSYFKLNTYRSSYLTNSQLAFAAFAMILFCYSIVLLSQLSGGLLSKTQIKEILCQKYLTNVKGKYISLNSSKGLVNGQFLDLTNLNERSLNCFACFKDVNLYQRPFAIENILILNQTSNKVNSFDTGYTIITSSKKAEQGCWNNAYDITTLDDFPSVSEKYKDSFAQRGFVVEEDDQLQTLHFKKDAEYFSSSSQLFTSSEKNIQEIYLFQQFMTTDFDATVQYTVSHYNDKYFVNNQIFFLFWVGFEMLFGLIVFALGDNDQIDYTKVLVQTQGKRRVILMILILNNNPTFPIQIWIDSFTLRYINMISACLAQYFFVYYILETMRKIRSQKPSFIFSSFHMVLSAWMHFNMALNLTTCAISYEENINSEPSGMNLSMHSLALQISLFVVFFYIIINFLLGMTTIMRQQRYEKQEEKYFRSRKIFLWYGLIGGCAYLLREISQYSINWDRNLIYFDQFVTALINIFFVFLMWFFDIQIDEETHQLQAQEEEETQI